MIIRLVKMTFIPEKSNVFLELFAASKSKISGSEGCIHLELHREAGKDNVFFTISHWDSAESLEGYRKSELFSSVWAKTKIHFLEKPQTWTLTGSL